MAKKKKAPQLEAWCWYCDREFEDDKVLLQHQKAKHYKCSYCPRRLNTAGGLTVHLHQVHKAEPTKIENALPGRDSFDIEIYGMVGIPEADLAEWQARKSSQSGGGQASQPQAKRQKVENVALTPEQLKAQLQAHKALMSGHAPPPGSVPPQFGHGQPQIGASAHPPPPPQFTQPRPPFGPPPGFPHSGPPPHLMPPYNGPPPSFAWPPTGPPPNMSAAPSLTPHQIAVRDGAKSRLVYSDQVTSPEEKLASSSKYAYVDPDDPAQAQQIQQQQFQHQQQQPHPQHWQNQGAFPYYAGPPPGWPQSVHAPPSSANLAAGRPPPQGSSSPYPSASAGSPTYGHPAPSAAYAGSPGSAPSNGAGPFSRPPPSSNMDLGMNETAISQSQRTNQSTPQLDLISQPTSQSYPAVPPGGSPPAARPEANTAEALEAANVATAAAESSSGQREEEVRSMETMAKEERQADESQSRTPGSSELDTSKVSTAPTETKDTNASESSSVRSVPGRRAKAADLF